MENELFQKSESRKEEGSGGIENELVSITLETPVCLSSDGKGKVSPRKGGEKEQGKKECCAEACELCCDEIGERNGAALQGASTTLPSILRNLTGQQQEKEHLVPMQAGKEGIDQKKKFVEPPKEPITISTNPSSSSNELLFPDKARSKSRRKGSDTYPLLHSASKSHFLAETSKSRRPGESQHQTRRKRFFVPAPVSMDAAEGNIGLDFQIGLCKF